jgi:hypothetical protein
VRNPPWSVLDVLLFFFGGVAGAVIGWYFAQQKVAQYLATGARLREDIRGPLVLSYLFMGWIPGTIAGYLLGKLRRFFAQRRSRAAAQLDR